jgi:GTP pyrophosphokinase
VAWGKSAGATQPGQRTPVYPLDVVVQADDRPGLLRDVSEVFAANKMNVTGVNTQSTNSQNSGRNNGQSTAFMTFTVEATDTSRLAPVLAQINSVAGVRNARRR